MSISIKYWALRTALKAMIKGHSAAASALQQEGTKVPALLALRQLAGQYLAGKASTSRAVVEELEALLKHFGEEDSDRALKKACTRCKKGVVETGNNDMPCDCPLGDIALFSTPRGVITGRELKQGS